MPALFWYDLTLTRNRQMQAFISRLMAWSMALVAGFLPVSADLMLPKVDYNLTISAYGETHSLKTEPACMADNQVWLKLEGLPAGELQIGSYAEGRALQVTGVLGIDEAGEKRRLPLKMEAVSRGNLKLLLGYALLEPGIKSCYVCFCPFAAGGYTPGTTIVAAVAEAKLTPLSRYNAALRGAAQQLQKAKQVAEEAVQSEISEKMDFAISPGGEPAILHPESVMPLSEATVREDVPMEAESLTSAKEPASDVWLLGGGAVLLIVLVGALLVFLRRLCCARLVVYQFRLSDNVARVVHVSQWSLQLRGRYRVGRSHRNSLRLQDPCVSVMHGEFTCTGGVLRYVDLGSTNGSRLNGCMLKALEPVELASGDELSLGRARITIYW